MIFKSLKELNKNTKISVLGHENPDVDSIFTGILVEKYLKFIGFKNAEFIINDEKIEKDTFEVIKYFFPSFDIKNYRKEISENVILVDHTKEYEKKNILGIIDHHPPFEWRNEYIYNRKGCSSSCVFIDLIKNKPFFENFIKENIDLFLVSAIIDCDNFRNPKKTKEDMDFILEYSKYSNQFEKIIEFADRETDISNIKEAINHGLKKYCMSGKNVYISYIQKSNITDDLIKTFINEIQNNLPKNIYLWALMIVDFKNNKTKVLEVYHDKSFENIFYRNLSRGKDLVPILEERLKNKRA